MNLVYVCREVSPFTGGGIGTYIANVIKTMYDGGHKVTLVTDFLENPPEHLEGLLSGIRIIQPDLYDSQRRTDFMCENQMYSSRVYETLLDLSRRENIDIIEFPDFRGEGFVSIQAKRTLNQFENTRLVVKCHTPFSLIRDINEEYFVQPRHELDIFLEDYSVKHADLVTSPSFSLKKYFEKRIGCDDIQICPYPLELEVFPERQSLSIEGESLKTVRYFGSIQPRKGLDHFVDAAIAILKEDEHFRFELFGGERNESILWTKYSELLKKRVPSEFQNRIVFAGVLDACDVAAKLSETAIVMLPSKWENWANVCLESMAAGCIVVASKEGGMGEMIENGVSGYHLNPKDSDSTAKLILEISNKDSNELNAVSAAAINRSEFLCDPVRTRELILENYCRPLVANQWRSLKNFDELPKVSVVIPYYNQGHTIEETIESVRKSDYPDIEIIVVNDGSTDPSAKETLQLVESSDVRCIHKANQGLSIARNTGIEHATGSLILPLDSDDTIESDYVGKAVTFLLNHPDVAYVGSYAQNFGAFDGVYSPLGFVKPLMAIQNTDIKCSGVFRKSLMAEGYDPVLYSYEDWDFLIGLNERGGFGDVMPLPLFNYRRNFNSMVFSTANHQKAHLLQYMMKKHQRFFTDDLPRLSQILLRLWSEEQFEREYNNTEVIQVYYGVDGVLSEQHSSIMALSRGVWKTMRFRIPKVGNITKLRIDPRASIGRVRVKSIKLETNTGHTILHCSNEETFSGVAVTGTSEGGWNNDSLLIHSTGNDPQVILEGFNTQDEICDLYISLLIDPEE